MTAFLRYGYKVTSVSLTRGELFLFKINFRFKKIYYSYM
nr:MAG TPA: hypothetical protein [Caudoviricetes sp.]